MTTNRVTHYYRVLFSWRLFCRLSVVCSSVLPPRYRACVIIKIRTWTCFAYLSCHRHRCSANLKLLYFLSDYFQWCFDLIPPRLCSSTRSPSRNSVYFPTSTLCPHILRLSYLLSSSTLDTSLVVYNASDCSLITRSTLFLFYSLVRLCAKSASFRLGLLGGAHLVFIALTLVYLKIDSFFSIFCP